MSSFHAVCFFLEYLFFPGLASVQVRTPVFIVGHARSGTMLLHRLMWTPMYGEVCGRDPGWLEGLVRAKRPQRLPVVLTRPEVSALLNRLSGVHWIVAMLLYGAGLRLRECLQLRVKDIEFSRNEIVVRQKKGDKDGAPCCQRE